MVITSDQDLGSGKVRSADVAIANVTARSGLIAGNANGGRPRVRRKTRPANGFAHETPHSTYEVLGIKFPGVLLRHNRVEALFQAFERDDCSLQRVNRLFLEIDSCCGAALAVLSDHRF